MLDDTSAPCLACGAPATAAVAHGAWPVTVTSDLRVWPHGVRLRRCGACGHVMSRADDQARVLDDLYATYASLHGALEDDHLVYGVEGGPVPRTRLQVDTLRPFVRGRTRGRFLDVGCNKGLMLRAFSREHPGWEVHGHELSAHHYDSLRDVLDPARFHTGPLEALDGGFDAITLLHTLEHVPDPREFLRLLGAKLAPGGVLLVQVPDLAQAPGDLVVYDHVSHFVPETLAAVVEGAGLEVALLSDRATPRELALVARAGAPGGRPAGEVEPATRGVVRRAVSFLDALQRLAVEAGSDEVGVFGTGLVGTWVGGLLGERLGFFVDESPLKVGMPHLGRPVLHPREVRAGRTVILAVSPALATSLEARWGGAGVRFAAPPPAPEEG